MFALVAKVCQTVSVEFDIGVGRLLCGRASRGIVDVASTGKDCSGTRVSGELLEDMAANENVHGVCMRRCR